MTREILVRLRAEEQTQGILAGECIINTLNSKLKQ